MITTTICINKREKIFLYQLLKNQDVFSVIRDKNANGESNTNILSITNLSAYENNKLISENVIVPFISPSIEKILVPSSMDELIILIKFEKLISSLNISFPKLLNAKHKFEFKFNICSIIK